MTLTEEQKIELRDKLAAEAKRVERDTSPIDLEGAKPFIEQYYKLRGHAPPQEYFVGTPLKYRQFIAEKFKGLDNNKLSNEQQSWTHFGNLHFPVFAFYKYLIEIGETNCSDEVRQEVELLFEITKRTGYCRFEEPIGDQPGWVYCCEKLVECNTHIDNPTMLHSTVGPSFAWSDLKGWHIEGHVVDEQIVMHPETQTIQQILKEDNLDVRRIRIERFGWPRFLSEIKAKKIDVRDNAIEQTKEALFEYKIKERGETVTQKVLVTHCPSTGRIYALDIPPEALSCEEAQEYLSSGSSIDIPIRVIGRS